MLRLIICELGYNTDSYSSAILDRIFFPRREFYGGTSWKLVLDVESLRVRVVPANDSNPIPETGSTSNVGRESRDDNDLQLAGIATFPRGVPLYWV